MKSDAYEACKKVGSRPRKGAWIEIRRMAAMIVATESPPQGGVD